MANSLTGFPETERDLRRRFGSVILDAESFRRPLARCDLSRCHGTCCHDGVFLGEEEVAVLQGLLETERGFFLERGIDPDHALTRRDGQQKTATVSFPHHDTTPDYPAHFPDTRCAFLLADQRCALQELSIARGRHPWTWKPFTCWLHPIEFHEGPVRRLVLHSDATDPQRAPGYPGFVEHTHCGRTCPGGAPAAEVLREELDFLGRILARDFVGELD